MERDFFFHFTAIRVKNQNNFCIHEELSVTVALIYAYFNNLVLCMGANGISSGLEAALHGTRKHIASRWQYSSFFPELHKIA